MSDGLPAGTIVVDERTDRVGEVMGAEGPYVQLRPLRGGREWDADSARVRIATPAERLSMALAEANAASSAAYDLSRWKAYLR
ncbi:hypothetical protein GCM10020367_50130 [Streptomyces sannanensis]|uniref:Uncharacterized protein n=1 Tax=Streptomyces sannanensis TaxID=285536 RepID=A0ABP6SHY3_9ACTN